MISEPVSPLAGSGAGAGRKLGLVAATALVMGNMIGSGVFLLPASLAPFGWNAVYAWLVSIGGSIALALSVAALARSLTGCGGLIGMLSEAFGPLTATVLGWSAWVGFWTANATLAIAAVSYLGSWNTTLVAHPALAACALVWVVTALSLAGIRQASLFQNVTMILKLVPLVVAGGIAFWLVLGPQPAPVLDYDSGSVSVAGIGGAVALTLWAMIGFEAAALAEDAIDRPAVNVPVATIIATLLTGVIYLVVCSAILVFSDPRALASSNAPFEMFVDRFWPSGPGSLIGLFAAISAIGALNGWTIVTGEVPRSMTCAGMLPSWFAGTNGAGAPRNSLLLGAACATVLLILNSNQSTSGLFSFMALLSTCAALWVYVACALAVLRLRLAPIPGAAGLAFGLWAIHSAGWEAAGLSILLMLVGLPVYWWAKREASSAGH